MEPIPPGRLRFTSTPSVGQASPLVGLSAIWVYPIIDRHADPACPLTEQRLRTIAELKLRAVGLQAIPSGPIAEADVVEQVPWLCLDLAWLLLPKGNEYVYTCALEVLEPGSCLRQLQSPGPLRAATFRGRRIVGIAPAADVDVQLVKRFDELIDMFINEWLLANPRP